MFDASPITAVVIGRNEGERLARCLESLAGQVGRIVYVDSGSTDGSLAMATGYGAHVVDLDLSVPFTAARARNAGLRLVSTPYALVVDGDCELVEGFTEAAAAILDARSDVAIVCGQRRERHPEASIYNRLCDLEWSRPAGEVKSCGGDALLRTDAVAEVGRYEDSLIAGEEPDLCRRLRAAGHTIVRTVDAMTWHDAAMTSWRQWWQRSRRAGFAYAEALARHGARRRECRSIAAWAVLLPLLTLFAMMFVGPLALVAAVGLLVVQLGRTFDARRTERAAMQQDGFAAESLWHSLLFAAGCVAGKLPQAVGMGTYVGRRLAGGRPQLIEYKQPASASAAKPCEAIASPAARTGTRATIGYLTTEYPKPSHTFVRRELLALERRGWTIERLTIRPFAGQLADPADIAEAARTTALLPPGLRAKVSLAVGGLREFVTRPRAMLAATRAMLRLYRGSQRSLIQHVAYLAEACRLRRHCQRRSITHLHVHFGKNAADVALLARELGGPSFSMTIHGPGEFDASAPFGLGPKVAASKFTAAISSFGTAQLRRWVPAAHWHKLAIVRCTIGDDFLSQLSPVTQTAPRFLCVGRLTAQKGQLLLVEAVAKLAARGVDVHLTLAGDGELREPIEALIAEHRLHDRVTITGWIDEAEVRRLLRECRALVLPSFAEGLPVAIMEALALGRPVISTMVAGIPELVRGAGAREPGVEMTSLGDRATADDRNGWLLPAGDVDGLVDALAEAAACDLDRLSAMGRAGHAAVAARHRTDVEASRLDRLLCEATGLIVGDREPAAESQGASVAEASGVMQPLPIG